MILYPYKTISSGKFTKWRVSVTDNLRVVVERYVRGEMKKRWILSQTDVQHEILLIRHGIPQSIRPTIKWAMYELRTGMIL